MDDFFKYLTVGDEIKDWGLFLNVAGKSKISGHIKYPSNDHPSGYYFDWDNGRVLQEYQINYITDGSGVLETEKGRYNILPGTLIITRKDQWHRYKPTKGEGWTEHYIGFDGDVANRLFAASNALGERAILHCGIWEELIDTYYKIFVLVIDEPPGYQEIASGLVLKLLGHIVAFQKQKGFLGKPIEKVIQKARLLIREKLSAEIDVNQLAAEFNLGYSYFRKMFKKYTGVSPHQYHLDLRMLQAKELISMSDKTIKEISYQLGFSSTHYFSRLFKNKLGVSPNSYRTSVKLQRSSHLNSNR
ncbi:MAG: AraC family transcriptional regulator [Bacteroidales bacterium]|nr:AraC family transcriptional regulator [Bacteroidales bacterium]